LPTSAPSPAPPPTPRVAYLEDTGTVRKESVDADRWHASGLVKVTGDARFGAGRLEGTVTVGGKVTADELYCSGTLEVEGAMSVARSLSGVGTFRDGASLHAGEADLGGVVRVAGAFSVDGRLTLHGSLSAPSLSFGELIVHGEAQLPGEVVGTSLTARLSGDSTFGTIRARSVELRGKIPNLVERVLGQKVYVVVDRIEAEEVELEGVDVKFVRAPKITIGRDAHVTEVEGTVVGRHPSNRVGYESKSRPPYGLTR
jgi:cytoskeletal protein CcmA (bactofilin family)